LVVTSVSFGCLWLMYPYTRSSISWEQVSSATPRNDSSSAHVKLTVAVLLYMSLFNLQNTWYLTSFSQQLHERTWQEPAEQLVTIFSLALPLGSAVGSIGSLLLFTSWAGKRPTLYSTVAVSLALTTAMCIAISFITLPVLPPHPTVSMAIAILLFGPSRSFTWTTYYFFAQASTCLAINTSGRRKLGCGNLLIAGLSGLLPLLISPFVSDSRARSTDRYAQPGVYLALMLIAGYVIPLHLYRRESIAQREIL